VRRERLLGRRRMGIVRDKMTEGRGDRPRAVRPRAGRSCFVERRCGLLDGATYESAARRRGRAGAVAHGPGRQRAVCRRSTC
jgi:hypothetical protein